MRKPDGIGGSVLHNWRRDRNIRQADLAKALGVSRQTIVNWEGNHTRIPFWVTEKLAVLAFTLMPKAIEVLPDWVIIDERDRRSDLNLFRKEGSTWFQGPEHPGMLLGDDHSLKRQGKWPWSALESPEYTAALEKWRRTGEHSRPPKEKKIMRWSVPRNDI